LRTVASFLKRLLKAVRYQAARRFPERFLLPLLQASLVARFLQETSDGADAGFNGVDEL
jgi:hypothetical protein